MRWMGRCLVALALVASVGHADKRKKKVFVVSGLDDACMGRVVMPIVVFAIDGASPAGLDEAYAAIDKAAIERAKAALEAAVGEPTRPHRVAALFELARLHDRLDDHEHAALRFADVLDLGDTTARAAALRHLAVLFGDACLGWKSANLRSFLAARDPAVTVAWRADLWRTLGELLLEMTAFDRAILADEEYLALQPLGSGAPDVQAAIVAASRRMRAEARATAERQKLARYGAGTAWHRAHPRDGATLLAAAVARADASSLPSADVSMACDERELRPVLVKARPALAACLAKARARTRRPELTAQVVLAFTQAPNATARVSIEEAGDAAIGACVLEALHAAPLPSVMDACRSTALVVLE